MKKKTIYIILGILGAFFMIFVVIRISSPKGNNSLFLNTIPLINKDSNITATPTPTPFESTGTPPQTNYGKLKNSFESDLSQKEKDKLSSVLPLKFVEFKTSTPISTDINVYSLPSDPPESIRLEIYAINFNNFNITSDDAIAFKDSFIQVKKNIASKNINFNNLMIIYGNRQYIQDTATFWVKEFKLLD